VATAISGLLGDAIPGIVLLLATGMAMIVNGALRLPRWARLRGRQMDALAAQMASAPTERSQPARSGDPETI